MVIAVKEHDRVIVGTTICDSFFDISEKDLALADNMPWWKVKGNDDCYVFAEDLNYSTDLLRFSDIFKGVTNSSSIITEVVHKMKELLGKHSRIINGDEWDSQLLIVKGNKMYVIGRYFTVSEQDTYACLGFENYMYGCLEEINSKGYEVSLTDKVVNALRYFNAIRNRNYFPLTTFNTATKKRKVFFK